MAMYSVDAFALPSYAPPDAFAGSDKSETSASAYAIPPAVWMIVFLILGYFLTRMAVEEIK